MNILFLVSTDNSKGVGGHFNSLHQVSLEMANNNIVNIIVLGEVLSPILANNPFLLMHAKYGHGLYDIWKLNNTFKKIFKNFKPDIIHCFDTNSLNRILLCPSTKSIPIIMNKCGGRNPLKDNYQHADATVVFSQENKDWYVNSKHYDNKSIFLIPNRVRALKYLPVELQTEKADPNKITFVRISRLGGAYEMTLLQTFNILEKLSKSFEVELFVIGTIHNQIRFDEIRSIGKSYTYSITYINDERAARGSDFLYLADFVVGTGRSFMEATSLGIPTLTPVKNAEIPILVNAENVQHFLATNFSERNVAREYDEKYTIEFINELVADHFKYTNFQKKTKDIFNEFFGTKMINEKYTKVYEYAKSKTLSRFRLIKKNLLYLTKFFLKGN